MPFTDITLIPRYSDLIVDESVGTLPTLYARDDINITPPAASAPVLFGTVVTRVKSNDKTAPYTVVAAAGDISLNNEYAVVLGDNYAFRGTFVPKAIAAGFFNGVAIVRGPIHLKSYFLRKILATLSDANFALLVGTLAKQGIVVVPTQVLR
jgi:hypothetical protein